MHQRTDAFVVVTVNNWSQYNPRKDVKKHSWFRFENDFLTRSRYRMLSSDDIIVMLYVFSERSKQKEEDVLLYYDQIFADRRITREAADEALHRLAFLKILDVNDTQPVRERNTTYERTNVRTYEEAVDSTKISVDPQSDVEHVNSGASAAEQNSFAEEVKNEIPPIKKHVSNAQVQETSMSEKYREFMELLANDGYKLTPAQRRAMPRSFAEWGEDLDAVSEFIASKFKYALKTLGRTEHEAERYAINAFIGEAVQ